MGHLSRETLEVVDAVIDWLAVEGTPGERFGATIDRVGLEKLVRHGCGTCTPTEPPHHYRQHFRH